MAGRVRVISTALAIASVGLGWAQEQQSSAVPQSSSAVTGSVVGHVIYDETKLPVRFAEIHLVPKPADTELILLKDPLITSAAPSTQVDPPIRLAVGSTGMDGRFRLDGVPAGDYFVAAIKPGYVTPGASTDLDASEDELKRLIPLLPSVSIAAGQVASVNLTLHRGAVISGRMQFADGSPAIGAGVGWERADNILFRGGYRNKVLTPLAAALQSFGSVQDSSRKVVADDEGRYRIYGLPPGKYVVSTIIGLNHGSGQIITDKGSAAASGREHMYPELITIFEPGVFRREDAKVFEIRGDEQVMDADFKIDPDGLHMVRGKVLASEDRHAPNGAMVRLREDGAKEVGRFVEIEEDGSFQINCLRPGSYTLEVFATDRSSDSSGGPEKLRYYKTVKLAVLLGEHDMLLDDVLLIAVKPGEKVEFPTLP